MANVEPKLPENCQTLLEAAVTCTDILCFSCPYQNIIYRSCEQGQCIDDNLAAAFEPRKKTAAWRSRKSSDSQEFEFDMRLGVSSGSLQSTQAVVASADELFYEGQLLPLEREPGMHPLFSRQTQLESDATVACLGFTCQNQSSSCRMDTKAIGPSLVEFRCMAGFCSQSNGHWESTDLEKRTEENSSSRDSNGSSLHWESTALEKGTEESSSSGDSRFSGDKDLLGHFAQGGRFSSGDGRPGQARAGALNLKSFFSGLKSVLKVMKEHSSNEVLHSADSSSQGPLSSSSSRYAGNVFENDATTGVYKGVNSKELSAMHSRTLSKVEAGSEFWRSKPKAEIEGEKPRGAWRRYARKLKPLYTKMLHGRRILSSAHSELRLEDREKAGATAGSARSRWSDDHDESLVCSSSRFPAITSCPVSVRSSPNNSGVLAIVTKSPSKPHPAIDSQLTSMSMSTMQELNSAIQEAIAHCKESISGRPVQVSRSAAVH